MTGQPKNENLPEISEADEWFDLDRSNEMTDHSDFPAGFDEPLEPDDFEPICCPACGSPILEYQGEAYDDDHHEGSAYRCDECGLKFTEESARDGTWE